jgi:hypothetical protein
VQDAHHEDQSHHVFGEEHRRGSMNHREQANLHVGVEN